jgi:hypothetical protein
MRHDCQQTSYLPESDSFSSADYQQDQQCTYNVTLRRVRATVVAVEEE